MRMLILILFATLFIGCDLFSTRPAEEPDTPRSNFQPAFKPEDLIQNLTDAFSDKDIENYLASLVDTNLSEKKFNFIPSAGAAAKYPSLTDNWNKKDEEQYFNNIKVKVTDNLPITLLFSNSTYSPQGDSLTFTSSYTLNVPLDEQDIPMNYQGELIFYMIRDNGSIWRIYYWQDIKNSDLPSWSELKGRFN